MHGYNAPRTITRAMRPPDRDLAATLDLIFPNEIMLQVTAAIQ